MGDRNWAEQLKSVRIALCPVVRGCAGVTESTGASCQRNDKTGTGKFSECGKAQRGDKNVGKCFVSGV
jgi:hypothetical protein